MGYIEVFDNLRGYCKIRDNLRGKCIFYFIFI
jgi:hypothetical protein